MLQCFLVFLERLGDRIWQLPMLFNYKPGDVFNIITSNCIYSRSVQQWQNEGEASFSQDVVTDSQRTRSPSFSSGRFYKSAVSWFHPFVQSFLDFDSGGECVSKVITHLHNVAGKPYLHLPP